MLKYELGIKDPKLLHEEEFKEAYADYLYLQKLKHNFFVQAIKQAIIEVTSGTEE